MNTQYSNYRGYFDYSSNNNNFNDKKFNIDKKLFPLKHDVKILYKNIYSKVHKTSLPVEDIKITVLPDFFVDRIIQISDIDGLTSMMVDKIKVGGGSIRGLNSVDIKGGNAVNVAYCLARLGVSVNLFTVADEIGNSILNSTFQKFYPKVKLYIKRGKHGLTTIFEFTNSSFSVSNVMLSDVGDNRNFGPDSIESSEILSILKSSSAVVLTNWASNLKGTELLKFVFSNSLDALHFLDPADISERQIEFVRELKINSSLIGLLSINENEFLQIFNTVSKIEHGHNLNSNEKHIEQISPFFLCKSSLFLSKFFKINICIHTAIGSVLSDSYNTVFVESISPSKINIVSGAGDAWDSAFLFGDLLKLTSEEKLCFANLYACLYLENTFNDAPSLQNILDYLNDCYIEQKD